MGPADAFAIYLAAGLIVAVGFHRIGQHEDPNDLLAHWSMIPFFALAWPFIVVLITGKALADMQERLATGLRRLRKISEATSTLERLARRWQKRAAAESEPLTPAELRSLVEFLPTLPPNIRLNDLWINGKRVDILAQSPPPSGLKQTR